MAGVSLKAERRDRLGKGQVRKLRVAGKVPGVEGIKPMLCDEAQDA